MQEKHCKNCGKLRTDECTRPDHCVQHRYSDFRCLDINHACPKHGAVLRVQKTDKVKGSNVVYTFKICPVCKYRVRLTSDYKVLSRVV